MKKSNAKKTIKKKNAKRKTGKSKGKKSVSGKKKSIADKGKTKTKKTNKGSGNNSRQAKRKTTNRKKSKPVRPDKRVSAKRSKISKKGKKQKSKVSTLSVKKVKAVKRWGKNKQNLFVIPLPQRKFQDKVKAIQSADLSSIERFLRSRPIEPLYVFGTLKIKKPAEKGFFYNGSLSPSSMVVDTENVRQFAAELLSDYNNNMVDLIQETYDEPAKVYNVTEITLRFLFNTK